MSDPKPGDRVTPENVASLPIGTVVEWEWEGRTVRATRRDERAWIRSPGVVYGQASIHEGPPTFIVTLGTVPTKAQRLRLVIAHLTHAARTDGAHHKQHDVCAALKVLLSAEDYAALGIMDEGVPS